eukprot:738566-Pyramimonas_sp.AAC.1
MPRLWHVNRNLQQEWNARRPGGTRGSITRESPAQHRETVKEKRVTVKPTAGLSVGSGKPGLQIVCRWIPISATSVSPELWFSSRRLRELLLIEPQVLDTGRLSVVLGVV